ncbi:MAG: hypothetical protein V4498_01005 [candidate division FCPU426 bacterium]
MNKLILAAWMALASSPAAAYVTSAILEYNCDDKGGFYLNGSPILEKSGFSPFDYGVLSTSDNTLPMELFNNFGENTLAIVNYDTRGGAMFISYRFTVHQSDGDPIVIWSIPEQAKMIHLNKAQSPPVGWARPDFDDSAWKPAVQVTQVTNVWTAIPRLYDPSFGGFMGMDPFVPVASHQFNAGCTTADHDYFRSHFRFPDHPARVQAVINPAVAKAGDRIAVRLIPGPDTSEFSQFKLFATLPRGLDLLEQSKGGQYDPAARKLTWNFGAKDLDVRLAKMGVASIAKDGGWPNMKIMLGREKPGKNKEQLNTPQYLWDEGAVMSPNRPSWFKMESHRVDLRSARPLIKGIIFHTQIKMGSGDTQNVRETDFIRLNYSVDGQMREALKSDVLIAHATHDEYWIDGYYDATEDRKWTWEDLDKLMVKLECKPKGSPDKNLVASCVATVKYYNPAKASPYFFARVSEPKCATLKLGTGVLRAGSPLIASDPVELVVNQQACAPTPVPAPTSTPIPKIAMRAPTPEPPKKMETVDRTLVLNERFGLGCVAANPQPFNFAGTFVSFCLKTGADITLNIYGAADGRLRRQMKAGSFREGANNQLFYNALDDDGKLLVPGNYVFELVAEKAGRRETRNATFQFRRDRAR